MPPTPNKVPQNSHALMYFPEMKHQAIMKMDPHRPMRNEFAVVVNVKETMWLPCLMEFTIETIKIIICVFKFFVSLL